MRVDVTVQIKGEDVLVGCLYQQVRHGVEAATFAYDPTYLAHPDAFALAPDMPLGHGAFHSAGLADFRALEDCMPDRWGRNLMMRAERVRAKEEGRAPRTLFETDMLIGVNDEARQGALRMWDKEGSVLSTVELGVPREASVPDLLRSADRASRDMDADIRDLLAAGSSLGGARPKASVRDERGRLCIAKFPKAEEERLDEVCAWERVALVLMADCGIETPSSRLLRVGGRAVLLMERFDREGIRRIPYISGLTAIQGRDGGRYSYLDLAEFIEVEGAQPERDLPELWHRALFTCAVGNTDNHMRNYGLLRRAEGWVLSPVFDVNPTEGDERKYLSTAVGFDEYEADPRGVLAVADYFRVSAGEAKRMAQDMARVLRGWAKAARSAGIGEASIARMASCFESGIDRLERTARL